MKTMLGLRRHNYLARVGVLLVIMILIIGTIGCAEPVQYSLTISSTEGGAVTTPEDDTFSYDAGTEVPLVALPHTGYRFVNWTGDVDTIDDVDDASTTITINGDYTITANFIKQYELTISSTAGGSVTTPGEGTYAYDEGEVINLVAQAEVGYHFVNWTGGVGTIADVNASITSITMNSNYTITANFTVGLYFQTEVDATLDGPAILPPEERNPHVCLQIFTNIVIGGVWVDLPDGRSITLSGYSDVFTPEIDQRTVFRSATCVPGMPTAGVEYVFTALDMAGEPIPGVSNADIWLGTDPPDPATNIRAEQTEGGILVSWDESPVIPGSFEPAAKPQVGYYQVELRTIETSELVYGAAGLSASPHLIPRDKADFIKGIDQGLSLSEMEDGTYRLGITVHSYTPNNAFGNREYISSDSGQAVTFTIQDGKVNIG
jgi:hypothetical protein